MNIWGSERSGLESGVIRDCSSESGLLLGMTRVCLRLVGCHGYDSGQVYVKAKYFWSTRPSKKLSEKNLGSYPIIAQVGLLSFTLHLPDSMHTVHLVFHVSQLQLGIPNTIPNWTQPPPPPVEVDGKLEFKISEIPNFKIDCRCKLCKLLYLVRWSGYEDTDKETLWLLITELGNVTELLDKYHSWSKHLCPILKSPCISCPLLCLLFLSLCLVNLLTLLHFVVQTLLL